ncbi:endonuclease/exonuclease/phosphatase family protein [Desulfobacterales bacterium HSG17]|nr:endonuclease/exonuclease/phosphatase family protein [Desulfobacterales bacterium HSG17]
MENDGKKMAVERLWIKKWWAWLFAIFLICLILGDILIVFLTHGSNVNVDTVLLGTNIEKISDNEITVLSLNMAHGRGNGKNQIFQSKDVISQNVKMIGDIIKREKPQFVALQEADDASWWSGNFSHVEMAGRIGGMRAAIQAHNVDGLGLHYGAAILTTFDVTEARQFTFPRNIPTFSKGFVIATCEWPDDPDFLFDVISLHLDFARAEVREAQIHELSQVLRKNNRPFIIMGDFNTDMEGKLLPQFSDELDLTTWARDDETIITFPGLGHRIDWIFVNNGFKIIEQEILDDIVSDHRVVRARIKRVRFRSNFLIHNRKFLFKCPSCPKQYV